MRRDQHGIIIQTSSEDPLYEDGGDSAFSSGMFAMAGSRADIDLLPKFIVDGKLVRHPFQPPKWNDPKETSRDQLVAFVGGMKNHSLQGSPEEHYRMRKAILGYAQGWWINKDILMPDVRLYLYMACGAKVPPLVYIFGWPMVFLSLVWDCFLNPDHEMNQAICKNKVFGQWWLTKLYQWHPGLKKNVTEYFGGWRDKAEIGLALNTFITNSVKSS